INSMATMTADCSFLLFVVDGTVPPVQMSSSPPGSLSNTASKAMSPSCLYLHIRNHLYLSLSLTSHYVDGQVSQRETLFRCGKNKNKFLDKELIIMGDTDRKKSLLHPTQSKRYILLLGNAGMGKTTLIKKLCLDWSREGVPQFDFVFLLDSKALTLTKPTFSLQTLLLNLSCLTPTCLDPDAVFAQIIAAPKRVLIIFDGFEELRDYETLLQTQEKDLITSLQRDSKAQAYTIKQLYSGILQRVLLPGCTLLLSARPRGTASQLLRRTDSYLEVCGFSPADIETYVSQYFADPALGASALECLKNCSYLHLLCWNPRLCRLVCFVLEGSKSLEVLPRTLTGLCQQVLHLKMREDKRTGERQLLFQLSSLAWNGVKANSSILPMDGGRTIPVKLKAIGQKTGLFLSYDLRTKHVLSGGEIGRDRTILQIFPFVSGQKGRRRPQREELELTQRFLFGLLFCNRLKLQKLHSYTETDFSETFVSKQAFVTKHLTGLSYGDLSPAQVLETCHYVHEASLTHANLPPTLTFRGVPLKPSDVFVVRDVLEKGGSKGLSFCLDLEDSGIQISGIRTLVGLITSSVSSRACIADVVTLWEQLEQDGKGNLKQQAVSKFKIHPLKATQVCHIEHLAKLVNVHTHKRLLDSSNQSDSVLAEGVPAVRELYKLEFELGPVNGPKAFPLLCELLPGLHNLQHLDLENSKIGDQGAEKVADALVSLCYLEVLNLSQNSIGDQGISKLATTLRDLPKLHCLSLYSNVISDEGAKSLAGILPHMASLTDLDVKYNKLTDVGAQSLGVSLSNCKRMKTLRLWNQCIPYGVFERLQQQDKRILWH
uniref:NACHT domain-containing protein n=1 Tax=Mola mola TaxID=94237 RepID=A0A3Q3WG60_MOLML